jgi:hypothetical protein
MQNVEDLLLIQIFAGVGTVLGAIFLIAKFVVPTFKRLSKWMNTWEDFMDDWFGSEPRPGRSRTKGVMERLNEIDGELKNNGGSSIKDAVDRIEKNVNTLAIDSKEIKQRLEDGDKKFDHIEKRLKRLEEKP